MTAAAQTSPAHFGTIEAARQRSGLSRSGLYKKAEEYRGLFRKNGRSVLVDFAVLDRILGELPVAKTK
jgi:hypothetical protein